MHALISTNITVRPLRYLAAVLACLLSSQISSGEAIDDGKVKALFLVNLASFIRWSPPQEDIVFCLQSSSDIYSYIRELAGFELGEQRQLAIKVDPSDFEACNIVYRSKSSVNHEFFSPIQPLHSALVVSDQKSTTEHPVDISLIVRNQNLKFIVNQELLEGRGFKISSRLLRLSQPVD